MGERPYRELLSAMWLRSTPFNIIVLSTKRLLSGTAFFPVTDASFCGVEIYANHTDGQATVLEFLVVAAVHNLGERFVRAFVQFEFKDVNRFGCTDVGVDTQTRE